MNKVIKTIDTLAQDGWIVASTPARDRQNDRVMPMGGDLTNYQRNPIVIFGHNYNEPWAVIGRAADMTVDMSGLRIRPELRDAANDADPMNIIRALWDQNLLRAASIGFAPIEAKANEFGGLDFLKWELLEISLVPVPANQEAIRMAVKALSANDQEPQTETITDDTEPAPTDKPTELTAEQEAELAQAILALSEALAELHLTPA